jgi:hypothetical protein
MDLIYCSKCDDKHEVNSFYIENKKSILKNGDVKIYTHYRCKKYTIKKKIGI